MAYCPLVLKFKFCSRAYFRQMCCKTCQGHWSRGQLELFKACMQEEREREKGKKYGGWLLWHWKVKKIKTGQIGKKNSEPMGTDESSAGVRRSKDVPVYHTWTSSPPSWWSPNHCSADSADTRFFFCFVYDFSLLWSGTRKIILSVMLFFIIIIIINIIVSLPLCFLV